MLGFSDVLHRRKVEAHFPLNLTKNISLLLSLKRGIMSA